jgi:glycosyltransferase involved in cell wall biosynthesis
VSDRIGIDGRVLGVRPKGIARYIWELCQALDRELPRAEFFLYCREPIGLPMISSRWNQRMESSPAGRWLPNSLWAVARMGFLAKRDNLTAFWGGTGLLPLLGLKARSVLSVHDLVYNLEPWTTSARARWSARLFFRASVRKADFVVCNSNGSARRFEAFLHRKADAVVRPGVSKAFRKKSEADVLRALLKLAVDRPYLLAVGTWEPRKGLQRLIPAFLELTTEGFLRNHILVIAGDRGWKDTAIVDLVQRGGERIRALGFIDDESLAALYSGTDALVFPSSYEGFGIPVLEARACGAPVVATDLPELREAGGEDAIYIPATHHEIKAGILKALSSNRPKPLPPWEYGWSKAAQVLAEVLTGTRVVSAGGAAIDSRTSQG